jgi:hypothetical protein
VTDLVRTIRKGDDTGRMPALLMGACILVVHTQRYLYGVCARRFFSEPRPNIVCGHRQSGILEEAVLRSVRKRELPRMAWPASTTSDEVFTYHGYLSRFSSIFVNYLS